MSAPDPHPGPLAAALGGVRVAAVVALLIVATPVLLLSALVPVRVGGVRLILRAGQAVCRAFLWVCGVRRVTDGAAELRAHCGMVFFNHPSFLDPLVLMAAVPVRFLGAAGVRRIPFVGPMAHAAGTLFVDRGDAESRAAARASMRAALADGAAPVALAPEGGIWHGPGVGPLRRGAFEVAADAQADVLLVALSYTDREHLRWDAGEWLLAPLWRLCARATPFVASLSVVGSVTPGPDTVSASAHDARSRLRSALGLVSAARPVHVSA